MPRDAIHTYREDHEQPVNILTDALQSIEINPVELCNRKCDFCPRGHDYKNNALFMHDKTAHAIGQKLQNIKYTKGISFCGFGEPLMHHSIIELAKIVKSYLPSLSRYDIITNGDFLSVGKIHDLLSAGIQCIIVNLYDDENQKHYFKQMFEQANTDKYLLRHHYYGPEENYGLTINNRAGSVANLKIGNPICRACFLPFYKFVIDWDGGIILCPQDWERRGIQGLNINEHTINEIWFSNQFKKFRAKLSKADRSLTPCSECDIAGNIHGLNSFKVFVDNEDI